MKPAESVTSLEPLLNPVLVPDTRPVVDSVVGGGIGGTTVLELDELPELDVASPLSLSSPSLTLGPQALNAATSPTTTGAATSRSTASQNGHELSSRRTNRSHHPQTFTPRVYDARAGTCRRYSISAHPGGPHTRRRRPAG